LFLIKEPLIGKIHIFLFSNFQKLKTKRDGGSGVEEIDQSLNKGVMLRKIETD